MGSSSQRVNLTMPSGRLRGLQCRSPQRQVVKLEVEPESEILAVIASDSGCSHSASAAHELVCRATGQTGATADVERPILVVMRPGYAFSRDFFRGGLLAARLLGAARLLARARMAGLQVAAFVVGRRTAAALGFVGRERLRLPSGSSSAQPIARSRVGESLRTFESFILLPLPGHNCGAQRSKREAPGKERVRIVPP